MPYDLERRTADFIATLDPLFAERPVYPILLTDEVPAYYHPGEGFGGWTSPFADLLARPLLEEQGRWVGRGFTFFMKPPAETKATDRQWLGQVVHEAGHFATFNKAQCEFVLNRTPPEVQKAFAPYATLEGFIDRLSGEPVCSDSVDDDARQQHDGDWIRATLHLVERADAKACPFSACATSFYGRLPGFVFSLMLCEETRELRDVPIREILQTTPPDRFRECLESPP